MRLSALFGRQRPDTRLLDGEYILGGCDMRMDPPTACVFPQSFDRVTVTKGPQTVL
jgi:iron complex outermembrane receptor protein